MHSVLELLKSKDDGAGINADEYNRISDIAATGAEAKQARKQTLETTRFLHEKIIAATAPLDAQEHFRTLVSKERAKCRSGVFMGDYETFASFNLEPDVLFSCSDATAVAHHLNMRLFIYHLHVKTDMSAVVQQQFLLGPADQTHANVALVCVYLQSPHAPNNFIMIHPNLSTKWNINYFIHTSFSSLI